MHVLILPSWYFPPGTDEIPGRMVHQLAAALRREGVDARVLYADFSIHGPWIHKRTYETEEGVPTWRLNAVFPPKVNAFILRVWVKKYVKELLRYFKAQGIPDLIHAHSYFAAMVCARLHEIIHVPYVYTERLSSFISGKVPGHHLPFLNGCFEKASIITCVSPGLRDKLRPFSSKEIQVIPNFFDEHLFFPGQATSKQTRFTWVSVGEPSYVKGLDHLLKAYALLKQNVPGVDMELILADRIPEEASLKALARELDILSDLRWVGLLTQSELADLFRKSHALVSASRIETFGKAIIEAQACGLPVVATATDGAKFILNAPGQGMLTSVGHVKALAEGMSHLINDYPHYIPDEIAQLAVKRFGSRAVIRQWIDLYTAIVR